MIAPNFRLIKGIICAASLLIVGCGSTQQMQTLSSGAAASGLWNVTIASTDGPIRGTVLIEQEGNQLSGSISSDRSNVAPFTEIAVDGKELVFAASVISGGERMNVTFAGTTEGDEMSGTISVPGNQPMALSGVRAAAFNPLGTWAYSLALPQREVKGTIVLNQAGASLAGTFATELSPVASPLTNVSLNGNELTFASSVTVSGNPVQLAFSGLVTGETLEGMLSTQTGNPMALKASKTNAP